MKSSKIWQLAFSGVALLFAATANADFPPPEFQQSIKSIERQIAAQTNDASEIAEQMLRDYDAQHPADLWLNILSEKDLKKLVRTRTNDLAPRLLLLPREPADDNDCDEWLANLQKSFALCTNEPQRVTCLALACGGAMSLGPKKIGKPMLGRMQLWLGRLSMDQYGPAVAQKIQYLRFLTALGGESESEVLLYSKDLSATFRMLVPLWMMAKGKWEQALKEVRQIKQLHDVSENDKSILDFYEPWLTKMIEESRDKKRDK